MPGHSAAPGNCHVCRQAIRSARAVFLTLHYCVCSGAWTLTRQLKAADKLREYVSDMCAEVKKGCMGGLGGGLSGAARSDVLAVGLIVVNAWVSERLEDAVCYVRLCWHPCVINTPIPY